MKQWRHRSIQHLEEAIKIKASFLHALAALALLHGEEKNFSRYLRPSPPPPIFTLKSNSSPSLNRSLRAEELFQQGLQKLYESDKGICQIFHQHYADFHFFHTKKEAEAIDHYTQVGFRNSVVFVLHDNNHNTNTVPVF